MWMLSVPVEVEVLFLSLEEVEEQLAWAWWWRSEQMRGFEGYYIARCAMVYNYSLKPARSRLQPRKLSALTWSERTLSVNTLRCFGNSLTCCFFHLTSIRYWNHSSLSLIIRSGVPRSLLSTCEFPECVMTSGTPHQPSIETVLKVDTPLCIERGLTTSGHISYPVSLLADDTKVVLPNQQIGLTQFEQYHSLNLDKVKDCEVTIPPT
jgi:hypothetical protein